MSIVGTHGLLMVQGTGGAVVKKVHGHPSVNAASGIPLGDLKKNDTIQILMEVELPAKSDKVPLYLFSTYSLITIIYHNLLMVA